MCEETLDRRQKLKSLTEERLLKIEHIRALDLELETVNSQLKDEKDKTQQYESQLEELKLQLPQTPAAPATPQQEGSTPEASAEADKFKQYEQALQRKLKTYFDFISTVKGENLALKDQLHKEQESNLRLKSDLEMAWKELLEAKAKSDKFEAGVDSIIVVQAGIPEMHPSPVSEQLSEECDGSSI